MRYLSDSRGFTLLELVAVLFILALAAGTAAVTVGRSFEKAALREEAARMRNTFRYARELALMEHAPATVVLDSEEGSYWIELHEERRGRARALPRGLHLRTEGEVIFLPKGQSTGGEVVIEDNGKRGYVVAVDPVTGEAQLQRL